MVATDRVRRVMIMPMAGKEFLFSNHSEWVL